MRRQTAALSLALAIAATIGFQPMSNVAAQGRVFAYPLKGQSAEKQRKDEAECHTWAVGQTGFNPNAAQPVQSYGAPPPQQSGFFGRGEYGQGGAVADLGKGAAIGAIGGAIGGDAGKGAAIGALAGGLFGGVRRSSQQQERQQWEQQQAAQMQQQQRVRDQQMSDYTRAYATCLGGRGYAIN